MALLFRTFHGFSSLSEKAQCPCKGLDLLLHSAPPSCLTSTSPLSFSFLNSSHTKLLVVSWTVQTYVSFRTFVQTNSCAWSNVRPDGHALAPAFPSDLCSNAIFSIRLSPTTLSVNSTCYFQYLDPL